MPSRPGNEANKGTRRTAPRRVSLFVESIQQTLDDSPDAIGRYYAEFGKRVKEVRENAGIRQEDVAACVDIDRSYLSLIESGYHNVALHIAHGVATCLGRKLDEMLASPVKNKPRRRRARAKR
jgi:DNA-binding XRE family transcriptional regulator